MPDTRVETEWKTIDEGFWNRHLPRSLISGRFRIVRVRPGSAEYDHVVQLRYQGLVESGFLDPESDTPKAMALPRDGDSIILGLYCERRLHACVTLNTPTERFPALAMELEKGVRIDHPFFRHHQALEFSKLVASAAARRSPVSLQLLYVCLLIARYLDKVHFWQVSRDIQSDISWRERFGFDYTIGYKFADPSLNGMPSQVGYANLHSVLENPRIHWLVRRVYRQALRVELG